MAHIARVIPFVVLLAVALVPVSPADGATIVRFDTVLGEFDLQLYDDDCPVTVANFLAYVENGDYDNSFFHRLAPGFVLQGGGFGYDPDADELYILDAGEAIVNEFLHSNVRGTIAMAKFGDDPDSATNQFFFNLEDNSANLDSQNGGFTVFGEVMGDGMAIVDRFAGANGNIDNIGVWDASSIHPAWTELPLIDHDNSTDYMPDNLELINSVTVIPEPTTLALLAIGAVAVCKTRYRRLK